MRLNIITHTNRKSSVSEAYRTLRMNIKFLNIDKKIKTIVLTSADMSEVKK